MLRIIELSQDLMILWLHQPFEYRFRAKFGIEECPFETLHTPHIKFDGGNGYTTTYVSSFDYENKEKLGYYGSILFLAYNFVDYCLVLG